MILNDSLKKVRSELREKYKCEYVISDSDYHQELVQQISDITNKMNEEKIQAIKDIESKYKEEIDSLQQDYALYLKFNS